MEHLYCTHILFRAVLSLQLMQHSLNKSFGILSIYEVTTFNGVPFHYEMLKKLKFNKRDLPSLIKFTQAGGHLNNDIKKYFLDYCLDKKALFFSMYGQTEASPRISFISFPDISEEPDSIGKAIHGCEMFLTSDNNEVITSPYVTGELNVKGPNIALGYSTSYEQLAEKDLFGGHLKTGDLAYFNQNGLFFVNGRKKRFVKLFWQTNKS